MPVIGKGMKKDGVATSDLSSYIDTDSSGETNMYDVISNKI